MGLPSPTDRIACGLRNGHPAVAFLNEMDARFDVSLGADKTAGIFWYAELRRLKHVLVYLVFRGRKLSIQLAVSKGVPGSLILSNVESGVLAWSILCSTF